MSTQVTETLEASVEGLLYTTETDEPFEVIHWPGDGKPLDAGRLLELTSNAPDTPVSITSLDDFFKDLTTEQQWYGDQERATMQRYRDLENVIRRQLTDVRVFRVGEVEVSIYVVGVTPQGDWAGVKTSATET